MKSATECLREYSIDIMQMDDHFNCQLLAAMERYAEQRSAHLTEGFVAALRVLRTMMSVEGLTIGMNKCDELLSELNSNEPGAVSSHEEEKEVCRSCFPTGIVPTDTKTIDIIEGGKTVLHRIR